MVNRTPDGAVSRHDVLLFSADPLASALLGAAVELAGHAPHFPQEGESARAALRRLRPRAVLIDCDHEEACSDAFIGPALMTGARVQLFRSRRTQRTAFDVARRLGLTIVDLPMEPEAFTALLRDLPATPP
jgi:DNA-binding NtrC family response regulator